MKWKISSDGLKRSEILIISFQMQFCMEENDGSNWVNLAWI